MPFGVEAMEGASEERLFTVQVEMHPFTQIDIHALDSKVDLCLADQRDLREYSGKRPYRTMAPLL